MAGSLAANVGPFVAIWKLVVIFLFVVGWLYFAAKLNDDAVFVHTKKRVLWSGLYLGAGVVGFLAWLLVPIFFVGLVLFVVFVAAVGGCYVAHRNGLVEPDDKIFTAAWFKKRGEGGRRTVLERRVNLFSYDRRAVIPTETDLGDPAYVAGYQATQTLLFDVMRHRAAEAGLHCAGEGATLHYAIDGEANRQPDWPVATARAAIGFLQKLANLDPKAPGRQEGSMSLDVAEHPVDVQVITAHADTGPQLQLRIVQELLHTNLDLLGLEQATRAKLLSLCDLPGVVIVSSPPKQGATSTHYSLLRKQDAFLKLITTLEARPPAPLANITQDTYADVADLTAKLGGALRRDPDVIFVDHCPTPELARMLCDYVEQYKKTVIVGMHSPDAFAALSRWVQLVGDVPRAISVVSGITGQVLVRTLCPACKQAVVADVSILKKGNLPPDAARAFYQPLPPAARPCDKKGNVIPCQACNDVGFVGRTGVFELLTIEPALREAILAGQPGDTLRAVARASGCATLQDQAIRKVAAGDVSLGEVIRILKAASVKRGDA